MISQTDQITRIFGSVAAEEFETAARESTRRFVRSNFEIGPLREGSEPPGHILTAWEAFQSYGIDILLESIEYNGAILLETTGAIESTLLNRRSDLGLSAESVAGAARVSADLVRHAEERAFELPLRELEKIAFTLGLDERLLAFADIGSAGRDLAFRLKTLQQADAEASTISAGTALAFTEAASIIRTQSMLMNWLGQASAAGAFRPNDNYGSYLSPAWQKGYDLAHQTRANLELEAGLYGPIGSMRDLVEKDLGIPVVQAQLQPSIAGATITTKGWNGDEVRGFVLNTIGENANVWVRRATLAHELAHILYDPSQELQELRVDSYQGTSANPEDQEAHVDYVEQRANAFAIAFLAPLDSVREMTPTPIQAEDIHGVMQTFGISYTAASYHVFNAHYRQDKLPEHRYQPRPSEDWMAAEDFTLDFFPVRSTPPQRRGRFAGLVAECYHRGIISSYTAALYLGCSDDEFLLAVDAIQDLHSVE